jgi:hypothetical protein
MGDQSASRAGGALALLALGVGLAGIFSEAGAEGLYNAEGAVFHDSNLSRALSAADIVGDTALTLAMSGGYGGVLGERDAVTVTADLRAAQFSHFHGMSSTALGGIASWRRKFGLGAFAPWTRLAASIAGERYGEDIRNGERSSVTLSVGKRVSEHLEFSGGGSFERYRANKVIGLVPGISGDAFSLEGRSLFARADYTVSDRWAGFARATARWGDATSSTRIDPVIFEYSNAITRDPAFGSDYIAYRLSGTTTWDFLAGASFALGDYSSLNLAVTRALTYASGGIEYQSTRINASVLLSY